MNDSDKEFGWGIWAEVSEDRFFEYVRNYESDNRNKAQFSGKVANSLPHYPETPNISLQVKLGNETQRPLFKLVEQGHLLTIEQQQGIALNRVYVFNGG